MASIGSKKINKNDIIYIITWKKWQLSLFFFLVLTPTLRLEDKLTVRISPQDLTSNHV